MRITIEVSDQLLREGMKLSHINTLQELINTALYEFLRKLKKRELAALWGNIEWEGDLSQMRKTPDE